MGSGKCWLVVLVTIRHMLCSLRSWVGWCLARRQQQWHGWFLLVLTHLPLCWPFPLCSLDCRQAQRLRLPGGFHRVHFLDKVMCCCGATTGVWVRQWFSLFGGAVITGSAMKLRPRSSLSSCSWLVLLVTLHFALCSFLLFSFPDACILAGMDQKDRYALTPWSDSAENCGNPHSFHGGPQSNSSTRCCRTKEGIFRFFKDFQPSRANSCWLSRARECWGRREFTPR